MTVTHQLAGLRTRVSKTKPEDQVIQTQFQYLHQAITSRPFLAASFLIMLAELFLQDTVNPASLLFLAQLRTVIAKFALSFGTVLTRCLRSSLNRTFRR
jgi:hypothetical protein